jgi:hypothetical protein
MSNLDGVVRMLTAEQMRLRQEMQKVGAALAAFGKTYGKGTGKFRLSPEVRERVAAAQRARWAKVNQTVIFESKVVPIAQTDALGNRKLVVYGSLGSRVG